MARTITSGGIERTYRLGVPEHYDDAVPHPVVVNLHGATSNAVEASTVSDLPRRAAGEGYLTVAPEAIDGSWDVPPDGADDAFLMAVLDEVEQGYCVDLDRIHLIGISMGAFKAAVTACTHPDRFASLVQVAEEVRPARCPAMATVAFHGTADVIVPYGEGADPDAVVIANHALPGARHNISDWADAGGCAADPEVTAIGSDVERWTYVDCEPGIDVELYTIIGGHHAWPGADEGSFFPTTQTIEATDLALDFFSRHPMPER